MIEDTCLYLPASPIWCRSCAHRKPHIPQATMEVPENLLLHSLCPISREHVH